jgi:hypothetical protein
MKLCAKWQQNIGYASEAPISKHQIPNNIQIPISNDLNGFVWNLGFACLPVGRDIGISVPVWFPLGRVR